MTEKGSETSLDTLQFLKNAQDFRGFSKSMVAETHQGVVLVSCSALDQILRDLLLSQMSTSEMTEKEKGSLDQAIKNFSSKVSLCLGLGLIHKTEARGLQVLNKVRNEFAHKWDMSFAIEDIQKLCSKLDVKFTDGLEKPCDEHCFDVFGYTASKLILDLNDRAVGLRYGKETGHRILRFRINRNYQPMWLA